MSQCEFIAETKTVAIAFDILKDAGTLGISAATRPNTITAILNSPQFEQTASREIEKIVKETMQVSGVHQHHAALIQSTELKTKMLSALPDIAKKAYIAGLNSTPEIQRLKNKLERLQCNLKNSPAGVWVDENKTMIVIVAAVGLLAGGTAMYYTHSGDAIASFAEGLKKDIKFLGTVDVTGQITKVEPSTRSFGAKLTASTKLNKTNTSLTLNGLVGDKQNRLKIQGELLIPIKKNIKLGLNVNKTIDSSGDKQNRLKIQGELLTPIKKDINLGLNVTKTIDFSGDKVGTPNQASLFLKISKKNMGLDLNIAAQCDDQIQCDVSSDLSFHMKW